MTKFPEAAYVVLITGLITIVTTILTQFFVARAESRKAEREAARGARERQEERQSKQREIKTSKLAELWLAVDLANERLIDAQIQSRTEDQILPPPAKDRAASATSTAYGTAILHFPNIRPLIYALHVETVRLETGLWFQRLEDVDAAIDRLSAIRTELADAIETTARDLQQS
jgi:hypothetical protein